MGIISSLKPVPPFRLDLTAWVLRRRPENTVDRWDGETYRRVLVIEGKAAEVEVVQLGTPDEPQLRITVTGNEIGPSVRPAVKLAISRTLGTSVDLTAFIRLVASDEKLKLLAQRFIGVKPPRFFTVFVQTR